MKYWINKKTGQKVEITSEYQSPALENPFVIAVPKGGNKYQKIYVPDFELKRDYIPITVAEYNSTLTLKEIQGSETFFNQLVKGDKVICISDCLSYGFTEIMAGDILKVTNIAENMAFLAGLNNLVKGKNLAVTSENINEHFLLCNENDSKQIVVVCVSPLKSGDIDIALNDKFVVLNKDELPDDGTIRLKKMGINAIYEMTWEEYRNHFKKVVGYSPIEEDNNLTEEGQSSTIASIEVGGSHYQQPIQVWDFVYANHISFDEANCIKYLCRHKEKGGAEDIRKVISYCKHILKTQYGEG